MPKSSSGFHYTPNTRNQIAAFCATLIPTAHISIRVPLLQGLTQTIRLARELGTFSYCLEYKTSSDCTLFAVQSCYQQPARRLVHSDIVKTNSNSRGAKYHCMTGLRAVVTSQSLTIRHVTITRHPFERKVISVQLIKERHIY